MTPTNRSLDWCRDQGRQVGIVERYNSFTKRRHDLFGFIDLIAIDPKTHKTYGIQTTSGANIAARIRKIREDCIEAAVAWIEAGNVIEVHGWRKLRGKWVPRIEIITFGTT